MIVNNIGFSVDFGKTACISFKTKNLAEAEQLYLKLKDVDDITLTAKKYSKRRSLDANAYLWVLINKMANMLCSDCDSVYLEMLKSYGQQFVVKIKEDKQGLFERSYKYFEKHETLKESGVQYYRVYIGSSQYDTKEMSDLINGVVSEAKELGIDTDTPEQIQLLLNN